MQIIITVRYYHTPTRMGKTIKTDYRSYIHLPYDQKTLGNLHGYTLMM